MNVLLGLLVATALGWAPGPAKQPAGTPEPTQQAVVEGFSPGTPVLTANGPVPVEAIQIGDWVVSRDVERGLWGLRPVVRTFQHSGPSGSWLQAGRPSAPRAPPGAGQRLWAGNGWQLAGANGLGPTIQTHTFEVADWHTYVVASDRGWTLAHNQTATVTYYRVQGGEGTAASRPLIKLSGSQVTIEHTTLNVSTGNLEHARHFLERRPGAKVLAFEIPLAVHERMVAEAIPQLGYRSNPANLNKTAPKIVDPTTPGQSFELPKKWAAEFDRQVTQGRVLTAEDLRGFAPRGERASPAPRVDFERARQAADWAFRSLKAAGPQPIADARLVIQASPAIEALADPATRTVRITTGLLDAVATRAGRSASYQQVEVLNRALSVVLAHEIEHLRGIRAERVADRGAVERLRAAGTVPQAADLKLALELFSGGQPTLLERIRNFARYGTVRGRLAAFDAAAKGTPDPLARFRRVDGTLRWAPMLGSRMLHESAGAGKFTLGLFVKELTLVLQTGDEARMDEFFSGITKTDFWIHYGVFAKSARSAELLYGRSLGKYIKNPFVSGLVRQNVALAAGLAVPQLLHGGLKDFDGKSFMISLTALGLSSTAVRAGAQGLQWLKPIKLGASRAAKVGGFLAQVGETALVLYTADMIESTLRPALARRALRAELVAAGDALLEGSARGGSVSALEPLIARHAEAWLAWRDYLFQDVHALDQSFRGTLEGLAERALELEQARETTGERLKERAGLIQLISREHGSLEGYLAARRDVDEREVSGELEAAFDDHTATRAKLLERVYAGERRRGELLGGWKQGVTAWLGPHRAARSRARDAVHDGLRSASQNRLQTYEDEAEVVAAAAALHNHPEASAALRAAHALVQQGLELETKIVHSAKLKETAR